MIKEDSSLYIAPNFEQCFMIPREYMPQLASEHVGGFLKKHGIERKVVARKTSELKPTQSQFNPEKIANMPHNAKTTPILISNDDYVLDGHHRWLANHYSGSAQNTIKLPWDASNSLNALGEYDKVFNKAIHEDGAPVVAIGTGAIDNTIPVVKKKTFLQWRNNKGKK